MTSRCAVLLLTLCAAMPAASATAQTAVPRTPDGKPDLQGFWDFRTLTPLERPANVGGKAILTEEEARALQAQNADRRSRAAAAADVRNAPREAGGGARAVGGYNDFWLDFGDSVVQDRRTSLIVDPPDGRLPARQAGVATRRDRSRRICRRSTRSACSAPAPVPTTPRTAASPSAA